MILLHTYVMEWSITTITRWITYMYHSLYIRQYTEMKHTVLCLHVVSSSSLSSVQWIYIERKKTFKEERKSLF